MEISQEPSMNTIFYFSYSLVLLCCVDDFLNVDGSTYVDPHD
jgi:hypothetical protein